MWAAVILVGFLMMRACNSPKDRKEVATSTNAPSELGISADSDSQQESFDSKATVPRIKPQRDKCRRDLKCWAERERIEASYPCKVSVEAHAKYDVKWTNSWAEPRMSRYSWIDENAGTVKYFGDKVQFQNGFGAWQRMIFSCDWSPTTKTATTEVAELL